MDKKLTVQILSRLLVAFLALCSLFAVLEVAARISDPMKRRKSSEAAPQLRKDKGIFRGDVKFGRKPENEFRIIALGDSFTWGDGLADPKDTWPEALSRRLRELYPGKNINVINLGIRGFTTFNEYELFDRVGKNLDPDLVIVQYLVNDVLPSGPNLMRVGEEWLSTSKRLDLIGNEKAHEFFKKHSYLYDFLNFRYLAFQRKIARSRSWEELYQDDFPGWVNCKKALGGFAYWSGKNHIRVILAVFPTLNKGVWTEETYPHAALYEKVKTIAASFGLYVVDVSKYFISLNRDLSDWTVSVENSHPNKEGCQAAADVIAKYIYENKLVY